MIESVDTGSTKTLGYRISGDVDKADIEHAVGAIKAKLEDHDDLNLYIEIPELKSMTVKALIKDITFEVANLDKFDRVAVVSDKAWVRGVAEIEDKLFPSVHERTFKLKERADAMEWVNGS